MKPVQGGTRLWCPSCKEYRSCRATDPGPMSCAYERRVSSTDHKDLHWFRRGRECQSCYCVFETAEVSEELIWELMDLRERKRIAESVLSNIQESTSDGLSRLRRLDVVTHSFTDSGLGYETVSRVEPAPSDAKKRGA